jgi:hypothetical protein
MGMSARSGRPSRVRIDIDAVPPIAGHHTHAGNGPRQDRVVAERRHDQRAMPGVETARDLKVAEMIVCRKDQFIRRAVPSALPYEAWREGNDSSWNPRTTYPAIERSASEPRGDGAAASIKVARGQG